MYNIEKSKVDTVWALLLRLSFFKLRTTGLIFWITQKELIPEKNCSFLLYDSICLKKSLNMEVIALERGLMERLGAATMKRALDGVLYIFCSLLE